MPRPHKCRNIALEQPYTIFKPAKIPGKELEKITISLDEMEAVRLADHENLYHEQAAERMGISRQTFGNILKSGRGKIADFLINGKLLKIEGGTVRPASGQ